MRGDGRSDDTGRGRATSGRAIVLCGLPGSGKSTWAAWARDATGATILSADETMIARGIDLYDAASRDAIEQEALRHAVDLWAEGRTVIVDFGSWARSERDAVRRLARSCAVPVHLVSFDADDLTLFTRIAARGLEARHGHRAFSWADVQAARAQFEPPTRDERAGYDPLPAPFVDSRTRAAAADAAP